MVPQILGRHLPALLFVLAAVIFAGSLLVGPNSPMRPPSRTATLQGPGSDDLVSVIVQHRGSAAEAVAAVHDAGGTVTREYTIIAALAAEVPAHSVEQLADHRAVRAITTNQSVVSTSTASGDRASAVASAGEQCRPRAKNAKQQARTCVADDLMSVFPAVVGATELWAEGITGAGVGIAFIDSGLNDGPRDDFGDRVVADVSMARGTNDRHGHGSLVASIAAGDGAGSGERFMGVAPGANVISVKVGNFDGDASAADVIAGLEWVLAHRAEYNIRVVNLSLSEGVPSSYLTNPLNAAVEQLWFNGIVVVTAQGNLGSGEYAVDHAPGNDPFVISVGAFGDEGTVDTGDDSLRPWSSRGVTHDGVAKPELIAPGSRLIGSVGEASSYLYRDNPEQRVGRRYLRFSGTSAAAPVVSGVVALMLEQQPELTPGQVKARLIASAGAFAGSEAGRVDAYAAVSSELLADGNAGVEQSYWLDAASGELRAEPVTPDGIRWDGIRWDGIRWDGIRWDGIRWDGIRWDGIRWD